MDNWSNREAQINRYWSCNLLLSKYQCYNIQLKGFMTPMGNSASWFLVVPVFTNAQLMSLKNN